MAPGNRSLRRHSMTWRKRNATRGASGGTGQPRPIGTLLRVEQGLEVEVDSSGSWFRPVSEDRLNGMGAALPDEGRKAARREKPLDVTNPGCGCGMKQARKPRCGVKRREAAKA
eukprot:TRINITY_DN7671_c0_g2_i1.p3 TRINITY_DN7671_c0_g2~~TRINITY_DN7671_c0_g2_i1.p3  ORF type:complete len:114 (-),score=15.92 TRINITY_DN7671_c0_g2_i1:429-770(-)